MEIFVLASGSKGNIAYLKVGHVKLFIDAGISYQKIKQKMEAYQENIFDVKSLLITHEHHDHIVGLKMLLKYGAIEHVYVTKGTLNSLPSDLVASFPETHVIEADHPFFVENLEVVPFMLSHDDFYLLEANHNPFTLFQSKRPFLLKKRIVGEKGHLSNEDAARLMNKLVHQKSIWVVAHISEDCNCIDDIDEAIVKAFDDPTKIDVYYASQEGLPVIVL